MVLGVVLMVTRWDMPIASTMLDATSLPRHACT